MEVYQAVDPIRRFLARQRAQRQTIGLVPTMGALHQGHLALIEKARRENDIVVCSIYVNPTQFNDKQDLTHYPRQLAQDLHWLTEAGCHAVFCPPDEVMYPNGQENHLTMQFDPLDQVLEGKLRPGHFSGVGVVVAKLFHVIQPEQAYFGQKDLQQFAIIRKLVQDLLLPVQLVRVPIVRNERGLALSSRNQRLSEEEALVALRLYRSLQTARAALLQGVAVEQARQQAVEIIMQEPRLRLEYLEIIDTHDFSTVVRVEEHQEVAVCVAAYVGKVRLIDNIIVEK